MIHHPQRVQPALVGVADDARKSDAIAAAFPGVTKRGMVMPNFIETRPSPWYISERQHLLTCRTIVVARGFVNIC